MKQEALKYFTDTYLTVFGLLIFFLFFTYIVIKAFKFSKKSITEYSTIPLREENNL